MIKMNEFAIKWRNKWLYCKISNSHRMFYDVGISLIFIEIHGPAEIETKQLGETNFHGAQLWTRTAQQNVPEAALLWGDTQIWLLINNSLRWLICIFCSAGPKDGVVNNSVRKSSLFHIFTFTGPRCRLSPYLPMYRIINLWFKPTFQMTSSTWVIIWDNCTHSLPPTSCYTLRYDPPTHTHHWSTPQHLWNNFPTLLLW